MGGGWGWGGTEVAVAGVFAVVARYLACGVAVGVVETIGRGLYLRLRNRVRIVDSYARDVGFFLCSMAI